MARYASLIGLALLIGCAKSENLDDSELEYVRLSVALGKIKASANDSADHARLRDSVFKAFGTNREDYTKRTESFSDKADRAAIVFRAIGDSLGIR